MSDENQIEIPQSFIALYLRPGQNRPTAPYEIILARYEQCEDMACLLTEHAQAMVFKERFSEPEVLERCHQGLVDDASGFTPEESEWVVHRLAELLGWVSGVRLDA